MQDAIRHAGWGIPPDRGAEWIHVTIHEGRIPQYLHARTDPAAGVPVYANHGRWVVDCPNCGNAQLACRTDRRFMCNECRNVVIVGAWRPVTWPAELTEIEEVLHKRTSLLNQNWYPGETLTTLRGENFFDGEN